MTEQARMTVTIECFRYDPERDPAPFFTTYEVEVDGEWRVLDCLLYIREHLDPGLAFFAGCGRGNCGRCLLKINGRPQLACMTMVEGDLRVEPVSTEGVVRDLWAAIV